MPSYPTLHEVRMSADEYWDVWERLLAAAPGLRNVAGQHSPVALGWKVEGDIAPLEAAERLFELGDSLHMGPVNKERSILTIRKQDAFALDTLQEIKLMQRRPSRPEDPLGADSLDLVLPHGLPSSEEVERVTKDIEVGVVAERNENHKWISVIYAGYEFKLKDHPVWETCVGEAASLLGLTVRKA